MSAGGEWNSPVDSPPLILDSYFRISFYLILFFLTIAFTFFLQLRFPSGMNKVSPSLILFQMVNRRINAQSINTHRPP